MKYFKNPKIGAYRRCGNSPRHGQHHPACLLHSPVKEISRGELDGLLEAKGISDDKSFHAYAGIYRVEGIRKAGGKTQKFFVTTHLTKRR